MFLIYSVFHGLFLSAKMISSPTTIMANSKPTIACTKYKSAMECTGASVGAGVAAAESDCERGFCV